MKKIIKLGLLASFLLVLSSFSTIEKVIPTMLKVTVLDKIGNAVEEATVTLYESAKDYEKEQNPVQTVTTNTKGKAFFKKLDPKVYYLQVEKGDLSNVGGGELTDTLKEGRINKLNVVIE